MNQSIMTMCPTMANPDAITSEQELRNELHRANVVLYSLAERLHDANDLNSYLRTRLIRLIHAHLAGDNETIASELDDLAEHYLREMAETES